MLYYASEANSNGKRTVRCSLCDYERTTHWPLHAIHHPCSGLPPAHEWREWLRLFADALGYSQAKAICAYIRWRAKGSLLDALPPGIPQPVLPAIEEGPGTELHKLIAELGITPTASCGCEAMRQRMNAWGPSGCREHREEILAHMRTAYDEASVVTKLRAGVLALAKDLPLTLAGLLDEAIRRAEQAAE